MGWTTPKTWAVGDPGTASDLNTYIRDNSAYLYGDTTWSSVTFTNSWAATGSYTVGYRRIGSEVALKGTVTGGANGTSVFTLPVGYRPLQQSNTPSETPSLGTACYIAVATAGTVTVQGITGTPNVTLDAVRFSLI